MPPRKSPAAILVRPRIYIGEGIALGPGKIDMLRQVAQTHSIAAAARALGLPYKRAWLLVDSLSQGFGQPVVEAVSGGKGGGGTQLTALGQELVARYDALERKVNECAVIELDALRKLAN